MRGGPIPGGGVAAVSEQGGCQFDRGKASPGTEASSGDLAVGDELGGVSAACLDPERSVVS